VRLSGWVATWIASRPAEELAERVFWLRDKEAQGESAGAFGVAAPDGVERGGFDGFESLSKA
jgi:hypothetical protein